MKTVRQQATEFGHPVVGALKRLKDDVFMLNGEEVRYKWYTDSEDTLYAVDWRDELAYIAGDDWCI